MIEKRHELKIRIGRRKLIPSKHIVVVSWELGRKAS
jgi:hypothetical protein